jgi:hypothetical protein
MTWKKLGIAAFVAWTVGACAQGAVGDGAGGGAGIGGGGVGGDPSTTATTGSTGSTTSSTTGSTTSSTTGSTTTTTTGAGGGGPSCGPMQHLCGGVCAGNTPQTGCFASSPSCTPCANPPVNGYTTCSASGACDFECNAGWQKSGNACACASGCCSDADCTGGQTCQGGTCKAPPCDDQACFISCFMQCGGACVNNTCLCLGCN